MQLQLWFSADGYRKTRDLRVAVHDQRQTNESLRDRNQALEARLAAMDQEMAELRT